MLTGILQPTHLIIILAVALLLLGPKRLPEAGRAIGQGIKEFRSSIGGVHEHEERTAPPDEGAATRHLESNSSNSA